MIKWWEIGTPQLLLQDHSIFPQPERPILRSANNPITGRATSHTGDASVVFLECAEQYSALRVPEPDGPVAGTRNDSRTIGAISHRVDRAAVSLECMDTSALVDTPYLDRAIARAADEASSVATVG